MVENTKHGVVEDTNGKFPNKVALELCNTGKRTLILTKKDGFTPPIQEVCRLRNFVSFSENECCFSVITENFCNFDCFIVVGKRLNSFEQEFFRQLRKKVDKEIVEIRCKGKDEKLCL